MSINNDDRSNFIGIYVKKDNNLKEIKKGCVIINGQIKYFYGIEDDLIAPGYRRLEYIINNKNADGYNETYIDTGVSAPATIELQTTPTRNLDSSTATNNNPITAQNHIIIYLSNKCYMYYYYDPSSSNKKMRGAFTLGSAGIKFDVIKNIDIIFNFNIDSNHTYKVSTDVNNYNNSKKPTENSWNTAFDSSTDASNIFFCSCSKDSYILFWNVTKLEKN